MGRNEREILRRVAALAMKVDDSDIRRPAGANPPSNPIFHRDKYGGVTVGGTPGRPGMRIDIPRIDERGRPRMGVSIPGNMLGHLRPSEPHFIERFFPRDLQFRKGPFSVGPNWTIYPTPGFGIQPVLNPDVPNDWIDRQPWRQTANDLIPPTAEGLGAAWILRNAARFAANRIADKRGDPIPYPAHDQ